jgi:hypothetical protein
MGFLPSDDVAHLQSKGIVYKEVEQAGQKGVVLVAYSHPAARFDVNNADILILLPPGYPDVGPDMFHLLPWVRLVAGNRYPNRADQPFQFCGQNWQRWSRHNPDWRPGIDGIWTMLKRIDTALRVAAA